MSQSCVKIYDLNFLGDICSSKAHTPQYFSWYRGIETRSKNNNVVVFTDLCLDMVKYPVHKEGYYKIAWLMEPTVINPNIYNYILNEYRNFDIILTHNVELIHNIPNAKYCPNLMSWVETGNYYKQPECDYKHPLAIFSAKNYAPGHKLRHEIVQKFNNEIHVYGNGYKPVDKKIDVIKDHGFSFAVENCRDNGYWSEKTIDLLYTRTVPIYYGSDYIFNYFNKDGFFTFENLDDLANIIRDISLNGDRIYQEKIPAIEENHKICVELGLCAEDYMYTNFLHAII